MNDPTKQTDQSTLALALKARRPRCGEGPLFYQVLNLKENCSSCGLDYKFIDTGDGPAVFAIFILGFTVLGGALWLQLTYEPALWLNVVIWESSRHCWRLVCCDFSRQH